MSYLCWSLLFLLSLPLLAEEEKKTSPAQRPAIHALNAKDWRCDIDDVEQVLNSAAGEMWRYFPERQLPPIEVQAKGGPIVLFDRGPQGQIRVKLDTGQNLWAQMAYQFAHEFTHILCKYTEKNKETKWFEESLCETASLFALRRMAETWKTKAPYPNWKSYAPALEKYAQQRLDEAKLPEGKTFAQWYRDNAEALRANSCDRPRNNVVAKVLLPLFEGRPEAWEAVSSLNTEQFSGSYTLADFLKAWQRNCPEKHKAFVATIAKEFELDLTAGN